MTELIKDLNTLTNVQEKTFEKLITLAINSMSSAVWETVNTPDGKYAITEIDIGIGVLSIKFFPNEEYPKYHFKPSDKLQKELTKVPLLKDPPITPKLRFSLQNKFEDVYKEIL